MRLEVHPNEDDGRPTRVAPSIAGADVGHQMRQERPARRVQVRADNPQRNVATAPIGIVSSRALTKSHVVREHFEFFTHVFVHCLIASFQVLSGCACQCAVRTGRACVALRQRSHHRLECFCVDCRIVRAVVAGRPRMLGRRWRTISCTCVALSLAKFAASACHLGLLRRVRAHLFGIRARRKTSGCCNKATSAARPRDAVRAASAQTRRRTSDSARSTAPVRRRC